jgi:SMC interacting uncharacterized protein involved in chromosome segregation
MKRQGSIFGMVRTWVSGGQSSGVIEKLQKEISDLEERRDKLVDSNKSKVFVWASRAVKKMPTASSVEHEKLTREVSEIIAEYESICQELFDKQVLLSERLDEQAKFDSLG